jgi:hypothetical protein
MTFLIILLLLGGLALIFSGVENKSLASYLQTWIGGSNAK